MDKIFSIENQITLDNETGLMIIEIFNSNDGNYDYYLYMPGFPLVYSFGAPDYDRYSIEEFKKLYDCGYFNPEIENFQ